MEQPLVSQKLLRAQKGKQTEFLTCEADIVFYGGAKGGGKTCGLLLNAQQWLADDVNGYILRHLHSDFNEPGSIWHEANKYYGMLGIRPNRTNKTFPMGKTGLLKFRGCQYDSDVWRFQGTQADFVLFDEVTQFSEFQFWFICGSLRTTTGLVQPYVRATCNPEDGWVRNLLSWWIDDKTYYPIPERAGKTIWLVRVEDENLFFETETEADAHIKLLNQKDALKRSICFIPATINDNPILLENDPNYLSSLSLLPANQRLNMMYNRWYFPKEGKLFMSGWFQHFDRTIMRAEDFDLVFITSDQASTTKTASDYTVFQLWGRKKRKIYFLKQYRGKYGAIEQLNIAAQLATTNKVDCFSIESASMGFLLQEELPNRINAQIIHMTRDKDKYARAYHIQQYVQNEQVYIDKTADYYADFISEILTFAPENKTKTSVKDDQVDAFMDAVYLAFVQDLPSTKTEDKIDLMYQPHYSTLGESRYGSY